MPGGAGGPRPACCAASEDLHSREGCHRVPDMSRRGFLTAFRAAADEMRVRLRVQRDELMMPAGICGAIAMAVLGVGSACGGDHGGRVLPP